MIRAILRSFFRFIFLFLARLEVRGLDNIPPEGVGGLLAANHVGLLDAPLVFATVPRRDTTALVADKYKYHPLLRPLVSVAHGIWINRESSDLAALRQAIEYIKNGGLLGVAPEGTRSRTASLQPAKTGVAYLADKAACPVVPCAIWGTENGIRRVLSLQRPRITITFGPAFTLPPVERATREADLQRNTDEIMLRIAAMLPPSYRGVYREHPRLVVTENRQMVE